MVRVRVGGVCIRELGQIQLEGMQDGVLSNGRYDSHVCLHTTQQRPGMCEATLRILTSAGP